MPAKFYIKLCRLNMVSFQLNILLNNSLSLACKVINHTVILKELTDFKTMYQPK